MFALYKGKVLRLINVMVTYFPRNRRKPFVPWKRTICKQHPLSFPNTVFTFATSLAKGLETLIQYNKTKYCFFSGEVLSYKTD